MNENLTFFFNDNLLFICLKPKADDGALPTEWEAVSHQPPDLSLPSSSQNPQQTASVAGGFVSSAVQSIWRVFNRQ